MERFQVIVCDDEAGIRSGTMRALRKFQVAEEDGGEAIGFDVIEAETGEHALELIEQAAPDILLLDLKLPGMSGLDVLERMGEAHVDTLTIMITAFASIESAVSTTRQGAFNFLPKPFSPSDLRGAIEGATRHLIAKRRRERLATEKRRARYDLISKVAHELRAPINAVRGFLYVLNTPAGKDDPDNYERILGRCEARIVGMEKLIADLVDLTRLESGQTPRKLDWVDLAEAGKKVIEGLGEEAREREIALHLDVDEGLEMWADADEMEIVLRNLASNAVKYNRDGGRVDVAIRECEGGIRVDVSDNGIGMTEEEFGKLFTDFARIRNEKTKDILGSGLGLSIVTKIAELYGGEVSVESRPDEGSKFAVIFRKTQPGLRASGDRRP